MKHRMIIDDDGTMKCELIGFTREELVAKYHELLASSGDSNTAVNMAIDADVESHFTDMFPDIQLGLEPLGPVLK